MKPIWMYAALTGAFFIWCAGSASAQLFSGPCGENDCSMTVTKIDSLTERVDILRSVVTHPSFSYGTVEPGDQITVTDAGGCVNIGGKQPSWRLYVTPLGPGSKQLYFGSIGITGVLPKTRLSAQIGESIRVNTTEPAQLILYYEDDDYHDNGYYKADNGFAHQCPGSEPAYVQLKVVHERPSVLGSLPPPPVVQPGRGALPWDLVELTQADNPSPRDDNNFLLNPRWFWQTPGASQPELVQYVPICGPATIPVGSGAASGFVSAPPQTIPVGSGSGAVSGPASCVDSGGIVLGSPAPQVSSGLGAEVPEVVAGPLIPFVLTSQMVNFDTNKVYRTVATLLTPILFPLTNMWCDGYHVNWSDVTYTGALHWEGWSGNLRPFKDDDYSIDILPLSIVRTPFRAGATSDNPQGIHGEFPSFETVRNFGESQWWKEFQDAVEPSVTLSTAPPTTVPVGQPAEVPAQKLIEGHDGIMTGIMGIDTVHGGKAEIHPVHALAIREALFPNPADDAWAVFVRNWGNEGDCATHQHYIKRDPNTPEDPNDPREFISIRFPRPLGIPSSANAVFGDGTVIIPQDIPSVRGERLYTLNMKDGDAVVTFKLNVPTRKSYQFGEIHLVWVPAAGPPPPRASSVLIDTITGRQIAQPVEAGSPATGDEVPGEESAELVAQVNALSPSQLEFINSRVDAVLPPESAPSEAGLGGVIAGPPQPVTTDQIVFDGPDESSEEVQAVGLGALCTVTTGVTPLIPNFCVTVNTVHIEAETFVAQSGDVTTFGTDIDFGAGISVHDGSWVQYPDVNFGSGKLDTFIAFMASHEARDHIEVRLDDLKGKKIAELRTEGNGRDPSDLRTYREQSGALSSVIGVHDIFIVFRGGHDGKGGDHRVGRQHIGSVDWFGLRHTGVHQSDLNIRR